MHSLPRAAAPVLLAALLLLLLLAAPRLAETPPAGAGLSPAPVMRGFDGRRYDAQGLRQRLQAERVTRGERAGLQIFQRPQFSRREADGGRWEARAQRAEMEGRTVRLYDRVEARFLQPGGAALEVQSERMEWTPQAPLRAEGSPARFQRRSPQPVRGAAQRLYFDPQDRRLRLEGGAELERADGVLRGRSLEYFVDGPNAR